MCVTSCSLVVVRCSMFTKSCLALDRFWLLIFRFLFLLIIWFVSRFSVSWFVGCCLLVARCLLLVCLQNGYVLRSVRCVLFVACCLLFVVWRLWFGV